MEKVVDKLSILCWELMCKLNMNVIPVRRRGCSHSLESILNESETELFSWEMPPIWKCGCIADGMHGSHALKCRKRVTPAQVEELEMEIRMDQANRKRIADALRSREVLPPSPMLDQENVLPRNETAAEVAAIRHIVMNTDWWDDYVIDHRFRPNNTYTFSLKCYLKGDRQSYWTVGLWHPDRLKLLCQWCNDEDLLVRDLESLFCFHQDVILTADGEGVMTIPYTDRPSWYLTSHQSFNHVRERLMLRIAEMRLPRFMNICNLWEFHCSQCYVNLFTERVVNTTL